MPINVQRGCRRLWPFSPLSAPAGYISKTAAGRGRSRRICRVWCQDNNRKRHNRMSSWLSLSSLPRCALPFHSRKGHVQRRDIRLPAHLSKSSVRGLPHRNPSADARRSIPQGECPAAYSAGMVIHIGHNLSASAVCLIAAHIVQFPFDTV